MNGTPLIVLLLASVPIVYGLVGIWYPFRSRRFERLFYARWQRVDSRRVEMAVTWPIGFLSAFMGAWLLYDVMDSGHQPKWPMLAAFCAMVVWGMLTTARAWSRRLPDPTNPPEAEGGKQSTARPSHSTLMRNPGPARRIAVILALASLVLLAMYLYVERPWVGAEARIDRCVELRYERNRALVRHNLLTDYSRDELRAFCAIEEAGNNLTYKGGLKQPTAGR